MQHWLRKLPEAVVASFVDGEYRALSRKKQRPVIFGDDPSPDRWSQRGWLFQLLRSRTVQVYKYSNSSEETRKEICFLLPWCCRFVFRERKVTAIGLEDQEEENTVVKVVKLFSRIVPLQSWMKERERERESNECGLENIGIPAFRVSHQVFEWLFWLTRDWTLKYCCHLTVVVFLDTHKSVYIWYSAAHVYNWQPGFFLGRILFDR